MRRTFIALGNVTRHAHRTPAHLINQRKITLDTFVVCQPINIRRQSLRLLPDNQISKTIFAHIFVFLVPTASRLTPHSPSTSPNRRVPVSHHAAKSAAGFASGRAGRSGSHPSARVAWLFPA